MVKSILQHHDARRFEVQIRLDDDDSSRLDLSLPTTVKIHEGPRLGYDKLGDVCTELANSSDALWTVCCDDDNELSGRSFAKELEKLPLSGVFATPSVYRLNANRYTENFHQYGIVPNGAWKLAGETGIKSPTDTWQWEIYCGKLGWKLHRLAGMEMIHYWKGSGVTEK